MKSSFYEFNVAISGLFTARAAQDTIGHNIANASIKGYSRQYVEARAQSPLLLYNGRGMYGTGSEIFGVNHYRSFYLDKKYWNETPIFGEYSVKRTQMSVTENIFNELSGTGLSTQLDLFFDRIQELSRDAGDKTYRTNLIQLGNSMTIFAKNSYEALLKQQRDINNEVKVTVQMINNLGEQIASLNNQISIAELDGSRANDMRDQRMRLVDQLSVLVNVDVSEVEMNQEYAAGKYPDSEDRMRSNQEFRVMINGSDFVKGMDCMALECRERIVVDPIDGTTQYDVGRNPQDVTGLFDIYFRGSTLKFNIYDVNLKGELKALIDVRDGNNNNYFKKTATGSDYTAGELTLTFADLATRTDLDPNGGTLRVYDGNSGRYNEYAYKSCVINKTTNEVTFDMVVANPDTLEQADFPANATYSVGETTSYKGIPYYIDKLNTMIRTFSKALNEGKYMDGTDIPGVVGHVDGFDAKYMNNKDAFFTYKDKNGNDVEFTDAGFDYDNFNAANWFVNSEIEKDPSLLAASSSATQGISENEVILSFLKIKTNNSLFKEGSLSDYINSMTSELAIQIEQAGKFEKNYSALTVNIDNQRISVSGVDLNEEMINLTKYQQQYQAAAKLISKINEMYDLTINGLGI